VVAVLVGNAVTRILAPHCQPHSKPMANAIRLLRADAVAPEKDSEFVRKYWQIWKVTPKSDRDREWHGTDT